MLAVAHHIVSTGRYNREFLRRWWNWQEYLEACHPDLPATFESFEEVLGGLYAEFTFEYAARSRASTRRRWPRWPRSSRQRRDPVLLAHVAIRGGSEPRRLAGIARTFILIAALLGAIATEGGAFPNAWNKFVPRPIHVPPHPGVWQELTWPMEYPAGHERAVLPAAPVPQGAAAASWTPTSSAGLQPRLDEPRRVLVDGGADRRGEGRLLRRADPDVERDGATSPTTCCRWATVPSATTPTPTRQYDGQWLGFRQPVLRAARERLGEAVPTPARSTRARCGRRTSSGSSCRGGSTPTASSASASTSSPRAHPGREARASTSTTGYMFEHVGAGTARSAAAEEDRRRWSTCAATAHSRSRSGIGPLHEQARPRRGTR